MFFVLLYLLGACFTAFITRVIYLKFNISDVLMACLPVIITFWPFTPCFFILYYPVKILVKKTDILANKIANFSIKKYLKSVVKEKQ